MGSTPLLGSLSAGGDAAANTEAIGSGGGTSFCVRGSTAPQKLVDVVPIAIPTDSALWIGSNEALFFSSTATSVWHRERDGTLSLERLPPAEPIIHLEAAANLGDTLGPIVVASVGSGQGRRVFRRNHSSGQWELFSALDAFGAVSPGAVIGFRGGILVASDAGEVQQITTTGLPCNKVAPLAAIHVRYLIDPALASAAEAILAAGDDPSGGPPLAFWLTPKP
jgi:hypothetical protein